jgi:hypothetical protein
MSYSPRTILVGAAVSFALKHSRACSKAEHERAAQEPQAAQQQQQPPNQTM